jgi:DNA polymerase-4
MEPKAIGHLNIVGFRAAVAALASPKLRGCPYVIAGGGGRALAWDVSPQALREGIQPGMALTAAQRLVKNVQVIAPDPAACATVNGVLENIISRYAPVWQNDGLGNIYMDITGTRRLFGPPADCLCRIQNSISSAVTIDAAGASAANKLVCKVASRAIRPEGLIEVRPSEESAFLAYQDLTLLPGIGPSLMKTIRVTGFREIGELAALSNSDAATLFGRKGILLRDAARGIDNTPVFNFSQNCGDRRIERQLDFDEDVIDEETIRGALAFLAEHSGLEMRKDKLGAFSLRLAAVYGDGVQTKGSEKTKRLLVLDGDIIAAAERLYQKTIIRRIRIRSLYLSLGDLSPLGYEPDLFEPETDNKKRRLQETVDRIQGRYGAGTVMRGVALAASLMHGEKRLLPSPVLHYGY